MLVSSFLFVALAGRVQSPLLIAQAVALFRVESDVCPKGDMIIADATFATAAILDQKSIYEPIISRANVTRFDDSLSKRVWPLSDKATQLDLSKMQWPSDVVVFKTYYPYSSPLWASDEYRLSIFKEFGVDICEALPEVLPKGQSGSAQSVTSSPELKLIVEKRAAILKSVLRDNTKLIGQVKEKVGQLGKQFSLYVLPEELFGSDYDMASKLHPTFDVVKNVSDLTIPVPDAQGKAIAAVRQDAIQKIFAELPNLKTIRFVGPNTLDRTAFDKFIQPLTASLKGKQVAFYRFP